MSENTTLEFNCQEEVAYKIANRIAKATFNATKETYRQEYLDLYDECLKAVQGRRAPVNYSKIL